MPLAIGQTQIIDGSCWFYNGGLASPSPYQTKLEVTLNSQDIINNKSNVTLRMWARSINASYISSGNSQTPTIQGVPLAAAWFDCSVTNVWDDFGSRTFDVTHNADGTLNLACSASFTTTKTSSYSLRTGSISGSVVLATIPRVSAIDTFDEFIIGGGVVPIVLTRYSPSFTDDIELKINGTSILTRTGITTSYDLVPTTAETEKMIVALLGVYALGATLTVTTKSGATVIGTRNKTVFLTLKAGFIPYQLPKITSFDAVRCDSGGTPNVVGTYIKFIFNISASSLIYTSGQAEPNSLSYQIKYKIRSDSTYIVRTVVLKTGLAANTYEIVSGFPIANSYDIQFFVIDKYNSPYVSDQVPYGDVTMMLGKNAISIGKPLVANRGSLDAMLELYQRDGKKVLDVDDIVVGSFTPVITGATAAGVGTYVVQQGRYTKIGKLILVNIAIQISAHTGTGAMRVSLPFTSENTAGFTQAIEIEVQNLTTPASTFVKGEIAPNTALVALMSSTLATSVLTALTPMDTACTIRISGNYVSA